MSAKPANLPTLDIKIYTDLVKKAIEEGSKEAELIQVVELSYKRGGGYHETFVETLEIIYGDADIITLEEWGSEIEGGERVAIVPRTSQVVAFITNNDDTIKEVHVFNGEQGWMKLTLA